MAKFHRDQVPAMTDSWMAQAVDQVDSLWHALQDRCNFEMKCERQSDLGSLFENQSMIDSKALAVKYTVQPQPAAAVQRTGKKSKLESPPKLPTWLKVGHFVKAPCTLSIGTSIAIERCNSIAIIVSTLAWLFYYCFDHRYGIVCQLHPVLGGLCDLNLT